VEKFDHMGLPFISRYFQKCFSKRIFDGFECVVKIGRLSLNKRTLSRSHSVLIDFDHRPEPTQMEDDTAGALQASMRPARSFMRERASLDNGHDRTRSRDFVRLARSNYDAIVRGPAVRRGGAKAEHSSAVNRVDEAFNNSWHSATAESANPALPPPALPEHAKVDDRPVRGVVTLQARPSPMANERPRSALLIVTKGSLMVEELCQPYTRLLELPLEHVAAQAVPGRETMFHIAACPPGAEQRDPSTVGTEGIIVVLRDCSLRDRWLQALEAAGTRVDATGWHPAAGTAEKTRTPPACFGHGFEPPPVRWLH
jgi:hypothetical protein